MLLPLLPLLLVPAAAALVATEDAARLVLANARLHVALNKTTGGIYQLVLDGQDLLGDINGAVGDPATHNGVLFGEGGLLLDCYCVPPTTGNPGGTYTPGGIAPAYRLLRGTDAGGTAFGGIVLAETYPPTGQRFEQYWFLRDGETGLHTFSRLAYHNATTPHLRNLQEFRTMFRPNSSLWTTLVANDQVAVPRPGDAATAARVTVQDATWFLGGTPGDAYVQQAAAYFTKYTLADAYRDHAVHGLFADGSASADGSTFGAWLVQNTQDTFFGGPLHSDLTVDGIVYNYLVSNHHGAGTPNITDGFDRTFGPQFFYFNHGPPNASLAALRRDAAQYADPAWNAAFYDAVAPLVPGYVPSAGRGSVRVRVALPPDAARPLAVLSQTGLDVQDNARAPTARQYWAPLDPATGAATLPRVAAGTYRLTVFADGVFGDYTQDGIVVRAGHETAVAPARWRQESAGTELWRIGTPDKSSGEFRHGAAPDPTHPLHLPEFRVYWAAYDFVRDFPDGVVFRVGASREAADWNYVHWSVFGGSANANRPDPVTDARVRNWTVLFDLAAHQLAGTRRATLTVQLAAAKTAAGNTDVRDPAEPYADLPLTVAVNGADLPPWVIPYDHSSSAAVRSAVTAYTTAHKFVFDAARLVPGSNTLVLSLPFNATDHETALLPTSVYVQYDALRLEVE